MSAVSMPSRSIRWRMRELLVDRRRHRTDGDCSPSRSVSSSSSTGRRRWRAGARSSRESGCMVLHAGCGVTDLEIRSTNRAIRSRSSDGADGSPAIPNNPDRTTRATSRSQREHVRCPEHADASGADDGRMHQAAERPPARRLRRQRLRKQVLLDAARHDACRRCRCRRRPPSSDPERERERAGGVRAAIDRNLSDHRRDVVALGRAARERRARRRTAPRAAARGASVRLLLDARRGCAPRRTRRRSADIASETPSLKTISQSPGVERDRLLLEGRALEQADDRPAALEPPDAAPAPTTSGGLWPALQ